VPITAARATLYMAKAVRNPRPRRRSSGCSSSGLRGWLPSRKTCHHEATPRAQDPWRWPQSDHVVHTSPLGPSKPLKNIIEDRCEHDPKERHSQHPAEDRCPERPPHLGASPLGDDQGNDPQYERKGRHQDRPEPQTARVECCVSERGARLLTLFRKLDD